MAVRQGVFDRERLLGGNELLSLEDLTKGFDLLRRSVGDVGEGFLAHPLALAPALAQQNCGDRSEVGYGLDIHGNETNGDIPLCQN